MVPTIRSWEMGPDSTSSAHRVKKRPRSQCHVVRAWWSPCWSRWKSCEMHMYKTLDTNGFVGLFKAPDSSVHLDRDPMCRIQATYLFGLWPFFFGVHLVLHHFLPIPAQLQTNRFSLKKRGPPRDHWTVLCRISSKPPHGQQQQQQQQQQHTKTYLLFSHKNDFWLYFKKGQSRKKKGYWKLKTKTSKRPGRTGRYLRGRDHQNTRKQQGTDPSRSTVNGQRLLDHNRQTGKVLSGKETHTKQQGTRPP